LPENLKKSLYQLLDVLKQNHGRFFPSLQSRLIVDHVGDHEIHEFPKHLVEYFEPVIDGEESAVVAEDGAEDVDG
jgi:transcription elongation factor GreA-like protein